MLANTTIDLDLAESPLKAAIRLVEQKTGINVVVQGGNTLTGTVTLSVKDKPITEVLKLMANAAGADFWEQDGVYFFGPKGSAPKTLVEPIRPEHVLPPIPPNRRATASRSKKFASSMPILTPSPTSWDPTTRPWAR